MPSAQFPADAYGNAIPLLPVKYGSSVEGALSTTSTAAVAFGDGAGGVVRVWSFTCDMYYKFGASSLSAAALADAFVPAGGWFDVPLASGQTHFRGIAKSGTGTYRLELLGA